LHKLIQALPERAHLLIVGEVDQLPSVGPGSALADILRSEVVPAVRLRKIFRQAASSRIVINAHRINAGQMLQLQQPEESDFFFIEREEPESIQPTILYKHENLSAARSLRTAIASAFLWPTRTTSLLPLVIAV
jgi:exodeoxyribonuclease V alpha subunit